MCHEQATLGRRRGWGGDAALLRPEQRGLTKDNVSRFSWVKVTSCVLSADSEERDA